MKIRQTHIIREWQNVMRTAWCTQFCLRSGNFSDSGLVPRFNALMGFIPEHAINSSPRRSVPLARVYSAKVFR